MNAPVSYPRLPDYRRDFETSLAIRQQQSTIETMALILATAARSIELLSFPLGEPNRHYDVADMIEMMRRDFMPTQTEAEIAERAEELAA